VSRSIGGKEEYMPGRKLFTNKSGYFMKVELIIRRSENPADQAGSTSFDLPAQKSLWQTYGDNQNIYLNGIRLIAVANGALIDEGFIVIQRSSDLDNKLNMRNGVDFDYTGSAFNLSTRQVQQI
jgi:hypothetical protein